MKKLLIIILSVCSAGVANAATSPATAILNISGSLQSTCTTSFTGDISGLNLTVSATATGTTNFKISCTPGTSLLTMVGTSGNGSFPFNLHNSATTVPAGATVDIPYSISAASTSGFATDWGSPSSGSSGANLLATPGPVFQGATGTSDGGTEFDIELTLTASAAPDTSLTGNYSDIYTVTTTF